MNTNGALVPLMGSLESDVVAFLDFVVHECGHADNTRLAYQRALAKFMAFVQGGGVADYLEPQAADVSRFLEWLHVKDLAPASRFLTVTVLRSFYRRLVALGRLTTASAGPVLRLALPKIPERLPNVLSEEEIRRLLDAPCKTSFWYLKDRALLEFLFASGCRASEPSSLTMDNLDLDARTARIFGKGGRERFVIIGEEARQSLAAYIHLLRPRVAAHNQAESPPWVFLSRRGRQLNRSMVWKIVNTLARKAGLPAWVGAHSLRHCMASALLRGGGDVLHVKELLGHSNVDTTAVYLHLDTSQLRRVHDRFIGWRNEGETLANPPEPVAGGDAVEAVRPALRLSLRRWSPGEDELVRTLPIDEVVKRTGRSRESVQCRQVYLGVRTPAKFVRWTEEEDSIVRSSSIDEALARLPHRTRGAIKDRRRVLGVA